jgi:predicted DNA-binding protein (MmcQ/YjbR family)
MRIFTPWVMASDAFAFPYMLKGMWIGRFQHEKLTKQQTTLIDKCYMLKLNALTRQISKLSIVGA